MPVKQLEFNFDTTGVQLEIPFAEKPSDNLDKNIRLKQEIKSWLLSESELLQAKWQLETAKQAPLDPNA